MCSLGSFHSSATDNTDMAHTLAGDSPLIPMVGSRTISHLLIQKSPQWPLQDGNANGNGKKKS